MTSTPTATTMRGRSQLWLFGAAYLVYTMGRWLTNGDVDAATDHAHWIVDLESDLGVEVERGVQDALDGGAVMWVFSNLYLAAQLVVVPATLFFLYRRAPLVYRRLRDTVLATWMLAVPVYALFPVAPPRLAGVGLEDPVSSQAGVGMTGRSTMFYNEIAAVPSLHCGFAFAVGIALAAVAQRRSTKLLALAWGPLVSLTVVATGNHYVFDVAAGLLAAAAGYAVGRVRLTLPRWTSARAPRTAPVPGVA